jgi:hypothetical protein
MLRASVSSGTKNAASSGASATEEGVKEAPKEPASPSLLGSRGLYKWGVSTGVGFALTVPGLSDRDSSIQQSATGAGAVAYLAVNPAAIAVRGHISREYCTVRHAFGTRVEAQKQANAIADYESYGATNGWNRNDIEFAIDTDDTVLTRKFGEKKSEVLKDFRNNADGEFRTARDMQKAAAEAREKANSETDPAKERALEIDAATKEAAARTAWSALRYKSKRAASILVTRWDPEFPGRCWNYWIPGIYVGYVFASNGSTYTDDNVLIQDPGVSRSRPAPVTNLGTVGASWAPTPYFALLVGVTFNRIFDTSKDRSHMVPSLLLGFGGSLDIFARLIR